MPVQCILTNIFIVWLAFLGIGDELTRAESPLVEGDLIPTIDREAMSLELQPCAVRDPKTFWHGRRIFQKAGIVVADKDYVIRNGYWYLDEFSTGRVIDISRGAAGWTCRVRFNVTARKSWDRRIISEGDKRPQTLEVKRVGYKTSYILATYRLEGFAVAPELCGLIVSEKAEITEVEFPVALISPEMPQGNDRVARGADWLDGYIDGGPVPMGPVPGDPSLYLGSVVKKRDADGLVEVKWHTTGRTSVHRFDDRRGFFDIQRFDPDADGDDQR